MFTAIRWRGDHDGHLILEHATDGECGSTERVLDRPGDVAAAILVRAFRSDDELCVAAVYGVCLALRGVENPAFVRDILAQAIRFLGGANPESLALYRTLEELRAFIAARPLLDGLQLRDAVREEAHRIHRERFVLAPTPSEG